MRDHEFAKGKNRVQHMFYGSSEVPMTWLLNTRDQCQSGVIAKGGGGMRGDTPEDQAKKNNLNHLFSLL